MYLSLNAENIDKIKMGTIYFFYIVFLKENIWKLSIEKNLIKILY